MVYLQGRVLDKYNLANPASEKHVFFTIVSIFKVSCFLDQSSNPYFTQRVVGNMALHCFKIRHSTTFWRKILCREKKEFKVKFFTFYALSVLKKKIMPGKAAMTSISDVPARLRNHDIFLKPEL